MNKHDEHRRTLSINALQRARQRLESELLYLSVQQPPPMQEIYKVHDALDHVVDALDRLTAAEEVTSHG